MNFLIDAVLPDKCADCIANVAEKNVQVPHFHQDFYLFFIFILYIYLISIYGPEMQVQLVSYLYLL